MTNSKATYIKYIAYNLLGIVIFFVPAFKRRTFIQVLISWIGELLSPVIAPLLLILLGISLVLNYKRKKGLKQTADFYLGVFGLIVGICVYFQVGPEFLIGENTGKLAMSLSKDVFTTVFVAGSFVFFLSSFGLPCFAGTIIEPMMKKLYTLPGYAALDVATSITTSPAVDVFFTNKLYLEKKYTKREAASVVTNFSICSLGFFSVLCSMAGIENLYVQVVLSSFLLSFVIPIFTIRIYPLNKIPDDYIDGSSRVLSYSQPESFANTVKKALNMALCEARKAKIVDFFRESSRALVFGVKTTGYIFSVATIFLIISSYTDFFTWIGVPFIPLLRVLGVPDYTNVSSCIMIGITELALPTILISKESVSSAAIFYVVVLSTLQVVFFAESANAIIESEIPLSISKLIIIFIIRTLVAMPLVAVAMHILI